MTKTFVARPVTTASDFTASVDIVIPYHGQYERVTQLLESIFRLTRSNFYRVYVVDDSSPNAKYINTIGVNAQKNAAKSKQESIVITHRTEKQLGFAGACEAGYKMGDSPYVCFINSDCIIKDSGWLRSMGESLLKMKEQGVRVISPMTNNIVGGDEAQHGECFVRNAEDAIIADDSHLSLYCFMCHRQLFSRIGGFLKKYPYGFYEDEEFAARLKKHGFKQAVCRSSWVHHEGAATIRSIWRANPDLRTVMEEDNRKLCIEDMKKLI